MFPQLRPKTAPGSARSGNSFRSTPVGRPSDSSTTRTAPNSPKSVDGRRSPSVLGSPCTTQRFSMPRPGCPVVVVHVEMKYAQRMKERGQAYGVIVLNNTVCDLAKGCGASVRAILPRGSILAVSEPRDREPIELRGEVRP
ncbi:DddA-like double-stranded DNA deaminase toxin [Actinopolyspora mortivallis]|uniref:DddA-like double-stranded DNA deaminase toxin n=1 Tax=Actinopolyspora mortivallis TaxID=33906 RepID=UPI003CCB97AB